MVRQGEDDFLLSVNVNLRSLRSLQRTAISLTEIRDICQQIPAQRKLIILDACRDHPQMGRSLSDNLLQPAFARNIRLQPTSPAVTAYEVTATLYACSVDQRAYEWPQKQHGVFSYYLLQGLKGEALDKQGQITLNSLADYVQQQVSGWAQQHQGKERPQTPWLEQAGAATTVLVDKANPTASSSSPSLSNTIDPETEMWTLVKESTAISEVEAFLQAFPEGKLSVVAKLKQEQLRVRSRPNKATFSPQVIPEQTQQENSETDNIDVTQFPTSDPNELLYEMRFDVNRYTQSNRAQCTAIIEYDGREFTITPHGIRDIVCDEEHQAWCESPGGRRQKRSIHNTLNYCLDKNLFADTSLVHELRTIKSEKGVLRQTHLNAEIAAKIVKEFNQLKRVKKLGVRFKEIRLNGA